MFCSWSKGVSCQSFTMKYRISCGSFHRCPLSKSSLLFLLCECLYSERVLGFVKGFFFFFCFYWDDQMVFVLCSINIAYYITWFSDVKLTLHSWDKPTWGWYIIPLIFCWISFASILLRTGSVISKYRLNRYAPK